MNLDFTPEYQAFRAEVRDFLETHKDSAPHVSDRGVRSEKERHGRKFCSNTAMPPAHCRRNMAAMARHPTR